MRSLGTGEKPLKLNFIQKWPKIQWSNLFIPSKTHFFTKIKNKLYLSQSSFNCEQKVGIVCLDCPKGTHFKHIKHPTHTCAINARNKFLCLCKTWYTNALLLHRYIDSITLRKEFCAQPLRLVWLIVCTKNRTWERYWV